MVALKSESIELPEFPQLERVQKTWEKIKEGIGDFLQDNGLCPAPSSDPAISGNEFAAVSEIGPNVIIEDSGRFLDDGFAMET